jgi:hypothetical protein
MTTTFPAAVDTFDTWVDNVDIVAASIANNLQDAVVAVEKYLLPGIGGENLLYHSFTHDFAHLSAGGYTVLDATDDTYYNGLCLLLSNITPDIEILQENDGDPYNAAMKITFDANGQAGWAEFLLAADVYRLRSQTVPKSLSLSFDAINNSGVDNLRAGVAVWTGTENAITSDIVASWGATPTLATSWAWLNTPASIPITGTLARYELPNLGEVPDDAKNLAAVIWTPDTQANTDEFTVCNVKLEPGIVCTPFLARTIEEEKRRVGQFVTALDASNAGTNQGIGNKASTTVLVPTTVLPTPMWKPPTSFTHNISGYTASAPTTTTIAATNRSVQAFFAITGALTVTFTSANSYMVALILTAGTSWDGAVGDMMSVRLGPDVVAIFSSRL